MGQNLHNADSMEAVGRLMTVRKQEDFPADEIIGNKESHLFMNIVEHLLQHLCSEVVLDKQSYQTLLQSKRHDKEAKGHDAKGREAKEDREKKEYKMWVAG